MPFYKLHPDISINFQLNRVLTYGESAGRLDEIKEIAYRIRDCKDYETWFIEWTALAQKAEREGRYLHAASAYRMAEFFLEEHRIEKQESYESFRDCFYRSFQRNEIDRYSIPYEGKFLPAIKLTAQNEKAVMLIHGGYDSFMEEFFLTVRDFAKSGYTIIMFEGPGQGKPLKDGLKMTHEWEKPVKAVLDYFDLKDVVLLGISLGGYLGARAAAYEPRINKYIFYNVCYNFFDAIIRWMPGELREKFLDLFNQKEKDKINRMMAQIMQENLSIRWLLEHGMYIMGAQSPYDYYEKMSQYTIKGIEHLIKQDCLLLAGEKDHYIPFPEQYDLTKKSLINARSVTGRVFTEKEGGEQHAQLGNHHLAVKEIISWLDPFYT
jgi:pimeloyl-ACP methyl ester carboxylesterase